MRTFSIGMLPSDSDDFNPVKKNGYCKQQAGVESSSSSSAGHGGVDGNVIYIPKNPDPSYGNPSGLKTGGFFWHPMAFFTGP